MANSISIPDPIPGAAAESGASTTFTAGMLVVDLDGTLIKSDMLLESFWALLAKSPVAGILSLQHLLNGRASFKRYLAMKTNVDVATIPFRQEVLDLVRDWRTAGGRAALVTASDQSFADAIGEHLGCFDETFGSDGDRNLKGKAKGQLVITKYGRGNFDYVGDSSADLSVWEHCRRAITVDPSPALRKAVDRISTSPLHLQTGAADWAAYAKAVRPHQWVKNLLVFIPATTAHNATIETWSAAAIAFVAFSLVASSVYVLNDLMDLGADRSHPRKCKRPFASGAVPLHHGTLMAPGLLIAGLAVSLGVQSATFLAVLAAYFVLTTAYSVTLKRRLVIDICTLAGLYTIRVVAGGAATGLSISPWLLAFSIFIFLSLAAAKRQTELMDGLANGREQASGRAYRVEDWPIVAMMAIASGYIAVLVLALYIHSPAVRELYSSPDLLWGICPILLYWVSRVVMQAHRGYMDDDPIVFAVRDPVSRICGLLIAMIVIAGSLL